MNRIATSSERTGEYTSHFQLRELDANESQQVRAKVEEVLRSSVTKTWRDLLIRPLTLAVAWPGVGVLLLVAGVLMGRRAE